MRLTLPGYILLTLLIIVIIYFIAIGWVFFLTLNLDNQTRNSNSQGNITVSVPKEARVGEEIKVIVYYYPNPSSIINLFAKRELKQITFYDSTSAYSFKNSLNFKEISSDNPHIFGLMPYYETISYKIPQQVCPKSIVFEDCQLVSTKTGKGSIKLIYEPTQSNFYGGEGYQGDGEKIEVPIYIIK